MNKETKGVLGVYLINIDSKGNEYNLYSVDENLYKSIIKDRRRENVKIEIVRHTIFSILVLIMLIIASLIETYISTSLLQTVIGLFQ